MRTPPEMTCGFLIQLVFCKKKKKTMWFIGVGVEQETSAPPPKKNPGSVPGEVIRRNKREICGEIKKTLAVAGEIPALDLYSSHSETK